MLSSFSRGRLNGRLRVTQSSALALSTILLNMVRIVSTLCLTRLLSPEVYGVVGMIMSILYVINMLTDVGFAAYIIRHERGNEPDFLSSVWTIHAIRGAVLTVIAAILAWPISRVLAEPQLAVPLAVTSLCFLIEGTGSLGQFQALRDQRVQRYALVDLTAGVGQAIAAIALAFLIRNIWAIVASILVGSMIRVWASYALFPGKRSFSPDPSIALDLWRFSRVIAASSALTLLITQIDKLALSRFMPIDQFGTYVVASTLAAAPVAFALNYASGIVYPAVAAAFRANQSIRDAYYRCWGRFFYCYALGGGVLIGGADLLIRVLYDPRYLGSGRYLAVLAISTAIAMLTRSMESAVVAIGRTRVAVEINVVRVMWLIAGGGFALARGEVMIFIIAIGLMEMPAYLCAAWSMHRLCALRWSRELSLGLTITVGLGLGMAASLAARVMFPLL